MAVFRYGELVTDIINFLIVAFIVFLIARWAGTYFRSLVGSGGFIVIDESVDIVDSTKNLTEFYKHESCGWCSRAAFASIHINWAQTQPLIQPR